MLQLCLASASEWTWFLKKVDLFTVGRTVLSAPAGKTLTSENTAALSEC